MPKLTKGLVDRLTADTCERVVWDDELPGFGIRVWPSGKRVYILKYRTSNGRQRKPVIGLHGTITADKARHTARLWLAQAATGQDPSGERQESRRALSFGEYAERYMSEHAEVKKKPVSAREDRRMLDRVLLPAFGARKLGDITRSDIASLHHKMRATPFQANRAVALLSCMFNLAERWGLRPDFTNPCRHIVKNKEKKRERYLSATEFGRLAASLEKAEGEGTELSSAIAAIRLLIFTGARVSEILTLKWQYVDFEQNYLALPDSKTGAKRIYLNLPALEVMSAISAVPENPFVIVGGRKNSYLKDLERPWRRIRGQAELFDVRLHDLRHSFASVAVSGGFSLPMIGGLLGHRETVTTARYAHLAADPLREANEAIGTRLKAVMTPKIEIRRLLLAKAS